MLECFTSPDGDACAGAMGVRVRARSVLNGQCEQHTDTADTATEPSCICKFVGMLVHDCQHSRIFGSCVCVLEFMSPPEGWGRFQSRCRRVVSVGHREHSNAGKHAHMEIDIGCLQEIYGGKLNFTVSGELFARLQLRFRIGVACERMRAYAYYMCVSA